MVIILDLSHPVVWLVRHVCPDKAEFSFFAKENRFLMLFQTCTKLTFGLSEKRKYSFPIWFIITHTLNIFEINKFLGTDATWKTCLNESPSRFNHMLPPTTNMSSEFLIFFFFWHPLLCQHDIFDFLGLLSKSCVLSTKS